MNKRIELDIELPEFLDNEFLTLLSMLSNEEITHLKSFIKGVLFGSGRYTFEQIETVLKESNIVKDN
jgi:hypothetical protein|nr:hypothetical protein [uncultured Acetatifactor sp.]